MKVSLNEIKKYVNIPETISTEELIRLIGLRLVEVEGYEDLAPKYERIRVAKVVKAEKIPDTHLTLCRIDGGENEFVEEDGLVQVVCGAPNVREGMLTAWIMPEAIVPATFGEENFKLSVRKLRGYESKGMLAGIDELDLGDDHSGIVEIDPAMAKAGDLFADVFDLDDIILDIENKSLTHRPDCFGLIGFAREVGGIIGVRGEIAEGYEDADFELLRSKVDDIDLGKDICSRYMYAVMDVAELPKPSRFLTREAVFLAKAGMRTVDPIVDWTNVVMLKIGQPLHAFDYDKFLEVGKTAEPKIKVRLAKNGEKIQLLDEKIVECDENDILVTSNDVPVALAGAMGGLNTKIDASTRRVILESATFSLFHLRKTQMKHGIFSEAITRFTKGLSPVMAEIGMKDALRMAGNLDVKVLDNIASDVRTERIEVELERVVALLGKDFALSEVREVLETVGFGVKKSEKEGFFTVEVPKWRMDVHLWQDVAEEIGRLTGYENIVPQLPKRDYGYVAVDKMWGLKNKIRGILSDRLAMNEILTYSFVHKNVLDRAREDSENSYAIVNSISPELQYFRQSLVPSVLTKTRENLKAGYKGFALYEMNQVSNKKNGLTKEKTPVMENRLAIVDLSGYYELKAKVENLWRGLKKQVEIRKFDAEEDFPYFEPARSGSLYCGEVRIGVMGELNVLVLNRFKLAAPVAAMEVDLEKILAVEDAEMEEVRVTKYPYVERDVTFTVPVKMRFEEVQGLLVGALAAQELVFEVLPRSVYRANEEAETKNLSFHLRFAKMDKTLDAVEISGIIEKVEKIV